MAYINVIDYPESKGELREIYDHLISSRGKLAEVHKIQSLNPPTIVAHMDLYMKIMFSKSPLRRYQREMIGVVVSKYNDCTYCVKHHAEALHHFWKDDKRVIDFVGDYTKTQLTEIDLLLCNLAKNLTINPGYPHKTKLLKSLSDAGVDDRGILDAHLVVAYFNFVNRLVLGLGVKLEAEGASGYNYD